MNGTDWTLQTLQNWLSSAQVVTAVQLVLTDKNGTPTVALDASWTVTPAVWVPPSWVAVATQTAPLLPADFTDLVIATREADARNHH